jgi:hypothetical protein
MRWYSGEAVPDTEPPVVGGAFVVAVCSVVDDGAGLRVVAGCDEVGSACGT